MRSLPPCALTLWRALQKPRKLRSDGTTMLIVTHKTQFGRKIRGQATYSRQGRLVVAGPAGQMRDAVKDERAAKLLGEVAQ